MKKQIDPVVSAYMSDLAKKRKNPYYNFKDKAKAKAAAEASHAAQRRKREAVEKQNTPEG